MVCSIGMIKLLENLWVSSIKIPWRNYKDWWYNDALTYVNIRHWIFSDKKYSLKSNWTILYAFYMKGHKGDEQKYKKSI